MGQGETVGRPPRLVPAVRGGARHGGGGAAARAQVPGPALPGPGAPERSAATVPPPPPPARPDELETVDASELLGGYLNFWAAEFLRGLRLHEGSVGSAETATAAAEAVRRLRRAARRLSGTMHTYRPLLDGAWADHLSVELRWLSDTLSREYRHAARLDRLLSALHRLASDGAGGEADGPGGSSGGRSGGSSKAASDSRSGSGSRGGGQDSLLPAGTARAGALLERQLTLARTRAHSAALQALVTARFHAVADAVAVLAYEVPLAARPAHSPAGTVLVPLAEQARQRLNQAVGALSLSRAETPYLTDGLPRPVTARTSRIRQDAAWHEVRFLLRQHRYAEEVLLRAAEPMDTSGTGSRDAGAGGSAPESRPASATTALDRHRDAVEAAEAAAAAARTPRIAPATAYALGVLHADQRQEAEGARLAFGRLWLQLVPQAL